MNSTWRIVYSVPLTREHTWDR